MRILVTGASGSLGSYLLGELAGEGHSVAAWSHSVTGTRNGIQLHPVELEGTDIEARLDQISPDVILHLAAISATEAVRQDPDKAFRINVEGTRRIAQWCDAHESRLVFTSTDLVFDGTRSWVREDDNAEPILAYGRTKQEAEPHVLAIRNGLVVRVSLLYGFSRSGRDAYFDRTIAAVERGETQSLFEDEYRTPLDLGTAASALLGLAESSQTGLIHLGGVERMSRYDLIRRASIALGLDPGLVLANRRDQMNLPEPRPADVSLDTTRLRNVFPGLVVPTLEDVLLKFGSSTETGKAPSVYYS